MPSLTPRTTQLLKSKHEASLRVSHGGWARWNTLELLDKAIITNAQPFERNL